MVVIELDLHEAPSAHSTFETAIIRSKGDKEDERTIFCLCNLVRILRAENALPPEAAWINLDSGAASSFLRCSVRLTRPAMAE